MKKVMNYVLMGISTIVNLITMSCLWVWINDKFCGHWVTVTNASTGLSHSKLVYTGSWSDSIEMMFVILVTAIIFWLANGNRKLLNERSKKEA